MLYGLVIGCRRLVLDIPDISDQIYVANGRKNEKICTDLGHHITATSPGRIIQSGVLYTG